jgi:hypothetical protein
MLCLLMLLVASTGCDEIQRPKLITNPPPISDLPPADLPVSLRPYNWTDAGGSGSCVNASTVYQLRLRNMEQLADWWRKNHAGGETDSSIRRHHDAVGLKYAYTRSADPAFLDWCSRTRRGAIIWFYPRHCVVFAGFMQEPDGRVVAMINDNNRPTRYIKIDRREFLSRWRDYGGFALSILDPPVPGPFWPRFTER